MFSGFVISCEDIARLYAFHLTVSDVGNRYSEEVVGLIDTGSDASIVSQRLIEKLHLEKIGKRPVDTMNGTFESDEYLVNVRLSNNCVINSLRVSSTPATNVDFIIGTDILSRGDLSIENSSGKTKIRFSLSCNDGEFSDK